MAPSPKQEAGRKGRNRKKNYLPHRNASMDNPLENDEYRCQQKKICHSEEWKALKQNNGISDFRSTERNQSNLANKSQDHIYQAIQSHIAKEDNSIDRMHTSFNLQ